VGEAEPPEGPRQGLAPGFRPGARGGSVRNGKFSRVDAHRKVSEWQPRGKDFQVGLSAVLPAAFPGCWQKDCSGRTSLRTWLRTGLRT